MRLQEKGHDLRSQGQGEILSPGLIRELTMSRSRDWCFTINNPTEQDNQHLRVLQSAATYITYGREVGEEGTPHYQGFVRFAHQRTLRGVKILLPRAHLEPRRGTAQQAITYCQKDGDFEEWGDKPSTTETTKQRWRRMIDLAEKGQMETIKEDYPGMYLRYLKTLQSLARPTPTILTELTNEWWYGPTGTGKSRRLWELYPAHFQKELNKWWCGYQGEDVVGVEEWSPKNECTASFLKIWADRYPFTAQIKGGSLLRIRPKKIIILSNYTIDECFPASQDAEPIKRRFKVVHFPCLFFTNDLAADDEAINTLLSLSQ